MNPSRHDPSELEIQDFSHYELIIDARSPREYAEDHLPGATNLPVLDNEQYAEVGIAHKDDKHRAYIVGVAHSLRNIADAIESTISQVPRNAPVLVYCFRGGKRSRLWADALRTIGFAPDVVRGGWKNYRRWVRASLESLPQQLHYKVLCGPTGCGKTRLLDALNAAGEQVLDLEGLAQHRGSVIGAIPGVRQPAQKLFDSILLERLRRFDPARPIWVEAESKKIGDLQLPTALYEAMHTSPCYVIDAPMAERVKLWREDYQHFEEDPEALLVKLAYLVPLVGHEEFNRWTTLAAEGQLPALFERLMVKHYDPAYERALARNYSQLESARTVSLLDLSAAALREVAQSLAAQ